MSLTAAKKKWSHKFPRKTNSDKSKIFTTSLPKFTGIVVEHFMLEQELSRFWHYFLWSGEAFRGNRGSWLSF